VYQFFFFNATGEEAGWRGFALPRLQASVSPLVARLIIAVFWAPWHLFLWQAEGQAVFTWQHWIGQYQSLLPASIMIGWLYNRSRGSILVAGVVHASGNTVCAFLPDLDWLVFTVAAFAAAAVVVVVDRMWQRLPMEHPAVYVEPSKHEGEEAAALAPA
jgi:membrane protease YdiL (CAAX protease family)